MMLEQLVCQSIGGAAAIYFLICCDFNFGKKIRHFLAWVLLGYLLAKEIPQPSSNYYQLLNVTSNATKQEIHQAFRKTSKLYHPDKNVGVENAEAVFYSIKKAYDTLSHDVHRSNYNRFGDMLREYPKVTDDIDEKFVGILVALAVVTQGLCFVIGYLCTFPKPLQFARQIFLIYNISVFCLELHMRFVEDESYAFIPAFGALLPFERILVMRRLFPAVLCGSLMISNYFWSDQNAITGYLLQAILSTNRATCERLMQATNKKAFTAPATPCQTAGIKINGESSRLESAALKTRLSGVKLDSDKSSGIDTTSDKEIPDTLPTVKDETADEASWKNFAQSLTDEQRQHLKTLMFNSSKPAPQDQPTQASGFTWNQLLIYGTFFCLWLYYK